MIDWTSFFIGYFLGGFTFAVFGLVGMLIALARQKTGAI